MSIFSLVGVEFKKIKRSKILFILFFAMMVVWFPALINAEMNFGMEGGITPEHNLFIQSLMAMVWFIYPASMVIITLLLNQNERSNRGMLKMLSLPIDLKRVSLAKFIVLLALAAIQLLFTIGIYYAIAFVVSLMTSHGFGLPLLFVLRVIGQIYLSSIPMLAFYWLLSVVVQTPIFAIGIGFASIVPSVLMINSDYWYAYPICYPYYMVVSEYSKLSSNLGSTEIQLWPWVPVACLLTGLFLVAASVCFGKKERI